MVLDLLKTMSLKTGSVLMPFVAIDLLMANYLHLKKLFALLRVITPLFYLLTLLCTSLLVCVSIIIINNTLTTPTY